MLIIIDNNANHLTSGDLSVQRYDKLSDRQSVNLKKIDKRQVLRPTKSDFGRDRVSIFKLKNQSGKNNLSKTEIA